MANEYVVVYPPQLAALEEVKSNTQIIAYDPDQGKLVRIMGGVLYNSSGYPEWNAGDSYDEDQIVVYQLRFWKSLVDANVGNIPNENAFWTEVSPDEIPLEIDGGTA